ncbi:MAG TPA: hypothetical protein VE981_04680 [Planctomycetota bacterium]|nr:hypothetical protein [Planctomycetota bacterium]
MEPSSAWASVPYKEQAPLRGSAGDSALEARVVVASQKVCLNCDSNHQLGQPIATVVYVFARAEGGELGGDQARSISQFISA